MNDREIAVCRQQGHARRTRFQQLWSMVETMIDEKTQLEASLERLVRRLESDVLPVEQALAEVCRQALERLLLFSERKTLSKKRRIALTPWIDELLDNLLDVGHVDDALRDRFARHHAAVLDLALNPDSELSAWHQLESLLEQREAQEARFRREFLQATEPVDEEQALSAGSDDVDSGPGEESRPWQQAQGRTASASQSGSARLEPACLDDAVFKRLFRQTAAALHPDKEADEHRRQDKHVLMTRLLQARKDYDLITLMQLHERYAPRQSLLSSADERQLEDVLLRHLVVLQKQKDALADKSCLHYMAFHRFHDRDSEIVDTRIADYTERLEQRQQVLQAFLNEVVTLKQLRSRLQPGYRYLSTLW